MCAADRRWVSHGTSLVVERRGRTYLAGVQVARIQREETLLRSDGYQIDRRGSPAFKRGAERRGLDGRCGYGTMSE